MYLFASCDLERLADDSIGARFALRGEKPPHPDLAVVGIDAKTFQAVYELCPFPRSLH